MRKGSRSERSGTDGRHEKDADADLFERAMADVLRLSTDATRHVRTRPVIVARPRPTHSRPESLEDASDEFAAPGVDRRELRKLKRGDYLAADERDLHGMTADEACRAVRQFLDASRHRHRCVAIVHGRGLHSAGNVPVLRLRVRACLQAHAAVLAYADAPRSAGGAVVVLLRK
jgi:DNA-nicking Smr family endonuclease